MPEPTTLRGWAERSNFRIGVFIGPGSGGPYEQLVQLQSKEFNLAGIGLWWNLYERQRGEIDGRAVLAITAAAEKARMAKVGHPLIWPGRYAMPPWLTNSGFTRAELIEVMRQRISSMASLTSSRLDSVVVVNEAYDTGNGKDDPFLRSIGPDYVETAFEFARESFPRAKLIYNDYDNHFSTGSHTKRTVDIVDRLKSKSLIDQVGLQMIVSATAVPSPDDVSRTMQAYGIPVIVTEFAVRLEALPGDRALRWQRQADTYGGLLGAALESSVCKEFIVFNVVDKYSVWQADPLYSGSSRAEPTPFDDDFNPKPAYYAMLDVLKQHAPR